MEGPIYNTGTIHRQCNCPIKYHLNADYSTTGTLKLVLGHHYTGSRFCFWYLVWSSKFGYLQISCIWYIIWCPSANFILSNNSNGTIYRIITGSSYIQVGQGRLSNGICIILLWSIKLLDYWFKRSDKYGNEIARVLRVIGDLLLTATDESDIHSIDGYWYNVVVPST